MKRSWVSKYKSTLSCVYCGISNPLLLDFHHIDPENKTKNISSIKKKQEFMHEITLCEPVCANCHRKIHNGVNLCRLKTSKKEKAIAMHTTSNGMPKTKNQE